MKFMSTYRFREGMQSEAAKMFLAGGAPAPEGATILGRWHSADGSGGFVLMETDDPGLAYDHALEWSSVLSITTVPVLEDAEIGPILAKRYGS